MKRSVIWGSLLLLGTGVTGCPVYDSSDACYGDYDCPSGSVCDASGACVTDTGEPDNAGSCKKPSDCGTNQTCSRFGTCLSGDCSFKSVGCVAGYTCSAESGAWQCELGEDTSNGGAGGNTTSSGGAGGEPAAGAPSPSSGAGAGG